MAKAKAPKAPAFEPGDKVRVARRNGNDSGKGGTIVSTEKTNAIVFLSDGRQVRFTFNQLIKL